MKMNEADTRAELIDPKLKVAGWGTVELSFIRREVIIPRSHAEHRNEDDAGYQSEGVVV